MIAVILLGLVCTALTFMLYYSLIAQIGEEQAALGNYLTPTFALLYGVVLLGERITIPAVVGLALIIGERRSRCAEMAPNVWQAKPKPTSIGCVRLYTRSHAPATCPPVSPPGLRAAALPADDGALTRAKPPTSGPRARWGCGRRCGDPNLREGRLPHGRCHARVLAFAGRNVAGRPAHRSARAQVGSSVSARCFSSGKTSYASTGGPGARSVRALRAARGAPSQEEPAEDRQSGADH